MTHVKTPHPHKEMIIAKASNMDLVVFCNGPFGSKWHVVDHEWPSFTKDFDCFLCLPKHKDACLHWLNGGDVISANMDHRDGPINPYAGKWSPDCYFMSEHHQLRIKPKKVKRWIGVRAKDGATTRATETEQEARRDVLGVTGDWQFTEIEIEE